MLDQAVQDVARPVREPGSVVDRLPEAARRDLANPLLRNAYALMLNAGATGAIGVVYWVLAAHHYDAADVGRGSAAVSAMMLLSALAALSLTGTVSRFLPRAGPATGAFILRTYLASTLAAATITVGFLLTLPWWGASYASLEGWGPGVGFTIAVMAWGIFTLQDAVQIALRSAVWVPVENIVFGVVKVALVVGLATMLPHDGVFASWVIPVALSLVPVNLLIVRRLAPRHVQATEDRHAPPAIGEVGSFLAGDYVGSLFMLGVVYLVPVVVAAQVDPATNAYFFVAWIIGAVIDLLAVNMAISLTVEGTLDADRLRSHARAALGRTVRILLPIVAATVLLASPVLGVYGPGYARNAAPLLQVLALSCLPRALIEIYFGGLRAQSRTTRLAVLQGLRTVMVIGLTLLWTSSFGIMGAGWAVLVSQLAMVTLVAPDLVVSLRSRPYAGRRGARVVGRLSMLWPIAPLAALVVAGGALLLGSLRGVNVEAMNGYGLVSVLPVAALVGVGLLTLAFVLTLALDRPRPVFLAVQLTVLVVCLHGVAAFVESEARFPTAWQHLGFLDYIDRTGDIAPALDGRFNWPGFFAVTTFFARAVGISDEALLEPAPVVGELLYLVPYALLLACIRASWRTKWFAAFLLVVSNWVGQDYFSPQSFNFFVYLLLLAFVLTWFGVSATSRARGPLERVQRLAPVAWATSALGRVIGPRPEGPDEPGELPPRQATTGQRIALAALVMGLFAVSTASHQISPFMMLAAVAGLVVVGRCELKGLPLLFGVILASWLNFLATSYWTGHLTEIFGNVGSIGGNVEASVQGRGLDPDPQHSTVLLARLGLAGTLFALGALGALRRRRGGLRDRALFVLVGAPFLALGLQSYGGEVGLRSYLFALPALCILAASLFFGVQADRPSPWRLSAAFACALGIVGGFLVARYGNEPAERTTRDELAALDHIYDRDADGARVAWLTPNPDFDVTPSMPWGARDMEDVEYVGVEAPRDPDDVSGIITSLQELGPSSYLVVNRAQLEFMALNYSYPEDWGDRLRARLESAPEVRPVFARPDAAVYTLVSPAAGPAPEAPAAPGLSIGMTPWTPVGGVATVLLIAVLAAREVARIRLPVAARSRLAPYTWTSCVLMVVWAAVLLERYVQLS